MGIVAVDFSSCQKWFSRCRETGGKTKVAKRAIVANEGGTAFLRGRGPSGTQIYELVRVRCGGKGRVRGIVLLFWYFRAEWGFNKVFVNCVAFVGLTIRVWCASFYKLAEKVLIVGGNKQLS